MACASTFLCCLFCFQHQSSGAGFLFCTHYRLYTILGAPYAASEVRRAIFFTVHPKPTISSYRAPLFIGFQNACIPQIPPDPGSANRPGGQGAVQLKLSNLKSGRICHCSEAAVPSPPTTKKQESCDLQFKETLKLYAKYKNHSGFFRGENPHTSTSS